MSVLDATMGMYGLESTAARIPKGLAPVGDLYTLVNRLTFGFTRAEYQLARSLGYAGYLEYHLNPWAIDDTAVDTRMAGPEFPTHAMTPDVLINASTSDVQNQMIRSRLVRAAFSKRQFYERMVDFWSDHFSIWMYEGLASTHMPWDHNNVVRPHAMGSFPEMLSASAHSPVMLDYLNNNLNTANGPNENYARELMELHTMGVDGGYTQQDVIEVARCLTGWTYHGRTPTPATQAYTFRFNAANHDNGQKIVLGHIIPAGGGQQDGETVLKILAAHPSTARFISYKLLRHLWGDNPPQSLINSVAQVYLSTQGDIRSMIRSIINIYVNPPLEPKFKRPFHHHVSALRAVGAQLVAPGNLQTALIASGHSPFNWQPPDGYPDTLTAWSGLLLPRWNFGASLMNSEYGGTAIVVDINALTAGLPTPFTAAGVTKRINDLLFGGYMPGPEVAALTSYLTGSPPSTPTTSRIREAFGLAIGSPAFQWA